MSIIVTTSVPESAEAKTEQSDSKPAPESKETVQNESANSEAAETEEVEEKEVESKDDSDESEDNSEKSEESESEKPKKKSGFQRRIDKLNASKAEAQREAEYWKKLALEAKGAVEPKKEVVESKVEMSGEPDPDSFDSHVEYVKALTDWKIEQKEKAAKASEQKSKVLQEQDKALKAHFDREKSFAESTADYKDVITDLMESNPKISAAFEQSIIESDLGPALMYELAKNPAEFERINKLPPLALAREIGKIEFRLQQTSEAKKETKKITKAPEPISPVGSKGASAKTTIFDDGISQAEYERLRAKSRSAS